MTRVSGEAAATSPRFEATLSRVADAGGTLSLGQGAGSSLSFFGPSSPWSSGEKPICCIVAVSLSSRTARVFYLCVDLVEFLTHIGGGWLIEGEGHACAQIFWSNLARLCSADQRTNRI